MILSGKTIGELALSTGITSNSLFPIEQSGFTFHIPYSGLSTGGGTYEEVTYDELYSLYTGGTLTPGGYYLMTDFQTCYDQPNFNNVGDPIVTGNYKTGNTEPLLLLATSTTGFSPTVYSTLYPQDKITYDINWNTTEVTSSPAKGRITERIDEKNNRADYDFRAVQFIRYEGFFSEQLLDGSITIDPTGLVTGFTTFFNSDFVVGDILGVYNNFGQFPIGSFGYFEITSITSDTEMYVTGTTIPTISDTYYSRGISLPQHMSPFQCNVISSGYTGFSEYYTFNNNLNLNTYLGNFNNYNTFLLSNNVFLSGTYRNNYFGGGVEGNTFNEDMDSNICGSNFKYNIITNDFDDNTVGTDFQRNIIDCDMDGNLIGERFQDNMIGDDDGFDFDNNRIGVNFSSNFITMSQDGFINNNIGSDFYNNIIDSGFENNQIVGSFYENLLDTNNFTNNIIGESFFINKVYSDFIVNIIGPSFFSNNIYSSFESNTVGDNFNNNTLGDINNIGISAFNENKIGTNFNNNIITQDFYKNNVGVSFFNNDISGQTTNNVIGNTFENNTIYDNFNHNKISNEFKGNMMLLSFEENNVDSFVGGNQFSGGTYGNNIGSYTFNNDFLGYVSNNIWGSAFNTNTIGPDFSRNTIGNEFAGNTIGENFNENTIGNDFNENTIGNNFQWNIIDTFITTVDFTTNYGNITGFSFTATGTTAINSTYTSLTGVTNGIGVNASFDIEVSGGSVVGVSGNTQGKLYQTGDTITILGTQIGGTDVDDDVVITVTGVSSNPSVYESYTCQIFERQGGSKRLSYYDSSDTINITI